MCGHCCIVREEEKNLVQCHRVVTQIAGRYTPSNHCVVQNIYLLPKLDLVSKEGGLKSATSCATVTRSCCLLLTRRL